MNAIAMPNRADALRASMRRRLVLLDKLERDAELQAIEMEMCRRDVVHWFDNWVWTYDPRATADGRPATMPMDLFPRQVEMLRFFDARLADREDGLVEKSRDIGFTWLAGGYALHKWLFVRGFKTTFGSRKEEYVDKIGDPDSIFERIRMILESLPAWMRPQGFNQRLHDHHLSIIHPTNGNTIRGESGDSMGRGGRSTLYVIDEAAFIERAERVDAATSANADVRIWGSTVNGMGNVFARKRHGGMRHDQVFRFHWTDDPRKTPEWAAKKRASIEDHTWASEYDIDYSASVEGIAILARWVESARRIKHLMKIEPAVAGIGGLDVGGGGKGKSVFVARFGPVVTPAVSWGDPDTIETAHRGLDAAQSAILKRSDGTICRVAELSFDSVGIGKGVSSALSKHTREGIRAVATNVGEAPSETQWPDGETSVEKFAILKAEAWFLARERFKLTHEMVLHLTGQSGGQVHDASDLISLPDAGVSTDADALATQLALVKWGRNERGKIVIERKEDLARRGIASPDHAEALILTFAIKPGSYDSSMGWV